MKTIEIFDIYIKIKKPVIIDFTGFSNFKIFFCGKWEIRTLGAVTRSTVFETVPFDHSGNFPLLIGVTKLLYFFRKQNALLSLIQKMSFCLYKEQSGTCYTNYCSNDLLWSNLFVKHDGWRYDNKNINENLSHPPPSGSNIL